MAGSYSEPSFVPNSDVLTRVQKSVVWKIFLAFFVAIHFPLIALLAYLFVAESIEKSATVLVLLGATILGVCLSLYFTHKLLSPLVRIVGVIGVYKSTKRIVRLNLKKDDEISRLSQEVEHLLSDMNELISDLQRQASNDALTGLRNRRSLFEQGDTLFERARRDRSNMAVIVFDLDHFKKLNDTYGHEMGDRVLFAVAETLRANVRPYDIVARIGGEEFCLVMPDLSTPEAMRAMERLRLAIAQLQVPPLAKGAVTASFGLCTGVPNGQGLAAMMREADSALYEAKRDGRNRGKQIAHGTNARQGVFKV